MNPDRAQSLRHLADTLTVLGYPPMALDHEYIEYGDAALWAEIAREYDRKREALKHCLLASARAAYIAAVTELADHPDAQEAPL